LLLSQAWQIVRRAGATAAAVLKAAAGGWFHVIFVDLGRQLRWSYLPPLMVYLAAGISSLTAIVGTFFVKDYLGLSAAFLAALTSGSASPGRSRCRSAIWSISSGVGRRCWSGSAQD
jgi:hypothetical protein